MTTTKTTKAGSFAGVLQQIEDSQLREKISSDNCVRCGVSYDESIECIDLIGKGKLGIDRACGAHWCLDCYDKAQATKIAIGGSGVAGLNWYHELEEDWPCDNNTDLCPSCAHNPLRINLYGLFVELDSGETFELILEDKHYEDIWKYISSLKIIERLSNEFRNTGRIKPKDTEGKLLW